MKLTNACNILLNQNSGTLPNVAEAIGNYLQPMIFEQIQKSVVNGQVVETTVPVNFRGAWIPFTIQMLQMKPWGQRQWKWFQTFALTALPLKPDDVITYLGIQYRVEAVNDYSLYGYFEYHLVNDYQGVSP